MSLASQMLQSFAQVSLSALNGIQWYSRVFIHIVLFDGELLNQEDCIILGPTCHVAVLACQVALFSHILYYPGWICWWEDNLLGYCIIKNVDKAQMLDSNDVCVAVQCQGFRCLARHRRQRGEKDDFLIVVCFVTDSEGHWILVVRFMIIPKRRRWRSHAMSINAKWKKWLWQGPLSPISKQIADLCGELESCKELRKRYCRYYPVLLYCANFPHLSKSRQSRRPA